MTVLISESLTVKKNKKLQYSEDAIKNAATQLCYVVNAPKCTLLRFWPFKTPLGCVNTVWRNVPCSQAVCSMAWMPYCQWADTDEASLLSCTEQTHHGNCVMAPLPLYWNISLTSSSGSATQQCKNSSQIANLETELTHLLLKLGLFPQPGEGQRNKGMLMYISHDIAAFPCLNYLPSALL